jgi:hypothetical protein
MTDDIVGVLIILALVGGVILLNAQMLILIVLICMGAC